MRPHDSQRTVRPSDVAATRLREQLHRDVADFRVRLEEVCLRSEVHERTGNLDGVEAAITEQRQMLVQFERRIQHRIADSIVEREAEGVLGGAVRALQEVGADTGAFAWDTGSAGPGRAQRLVRTMAAAAAAVLATMLMLSSGVTPVDPAAVPSDSPQAAPRPTTESSTGEAAGSESRRDSIAATGRPDRRDPVVGAARPSSIAPDEGETSEFFEQLLNRIFGAVASVTATARPPLPVDVGEAEVSTEGLADELLDGAPDELQELLPDETAPAHEDVDSEPADDDTPTQEPASEEPTEEPDETSDDDGDDGTSSGLGWTSQDGSSGFGNGLPNWH